MAGVSQCHAADNKKKNGMWRIDFHSSSSRSKSKSTDFKYKFKMALPVISYILSNYMRLNGI